MSTTKDQVRATLQACMAVADAVKELKSVPSGVLYSQVMSVMDMATYNRIVEVLKGAGVVREESHLLTWVEPKGMSAEEHGKFPQGRWNGGAK